MQGDIIGKWQNLMYPVDLPGHKKKSPEILKNADFCGPSPDILVG